ncbi:MAG: hypothetical protein R3E69_10415 [Steroidobacteraceae bacterium]
MLRTAVIAILALSGCANAAPPGQPSSTAEAEASQLAREALARKLHVEVGDIRVESVTARTWSDSGMGCGAPGTVAATVITEGYAVSATAQGRTHLVHVSGRNVVVCSDAKTLRRQSASAARGIDEIFERAREDLARRLGVEPARIRLGGVKGQQWPDSSLGCPQQGETPAAGPVDGLLLTLRYAGRVYTYHTDRMTVRPCPAIEAE